jgi:hypothetical protein
MVVFTFPDRPDIHAPPPRRTPPPRLPLDHPRLRALTPHSWGPPVEANEAADVGESGRPNEASANLHTTGTATTSVEASGTVSTIDGADLAVPAEILDDLVAFLTGPAIGPHDDAGEPLDDDAIDDLIRHRGVQLVRAA